MEFFPFISTNYFDHAQSYWWFKKKYENIEHIFILDTFFLQKLYYHGKDRANKLLKLHHSFEKKTMIKITANSPMRWRS